MAASSVASASSSSRLFVTIVEAKAPAPREYSVRVTLRSRRGRSVRTVAPSDAAPAAAPVFNKRVAFAFDSLDPEVHVLELQLVAKGLVLTSTVGVAEIVLSRALLSGESNCVLEMGTGAELRVRIALGNADAAAAAAPSSTDCEAKAKAIEAGASAATPRLKFLDFVPRCVESVKFGTDRYESIDQVLVRVNRWLDEQPHLHLLNIQTLAMPADKALGAGWNAAHNATARKGRWKIASESAIIVFQIVRVWISEAPLPFRPALGAAAFAASDLRADELDGEDESGESVAPPPYDAIWSPLTNDT